MMFAGSQMGEEHGEGQQAGRHQVLRPQLHRPHTECSGCLFVCLYIFCIFVADIWNWWRWRPGAIWVALVIIIIIIIIIITIIISMIKTRCNLDCLASLRMSMRIWIRVLLQFSSNRWSSGWKWMMSHDRTWTLDHFDVTDIPTRRGWLYSDWGEYHWVQQWLQILHCHREQVYNNITNMTLTLDAVASLFCTYQCIYVGWYLVGHSLTHSEFLLPLMLGGGL